MNQRPYFYSKSYSCIETRNDALTKSVESSSHVSFSPTVPYKIFAILFKPFLQQVFLDKEECKRAFNVFRVDIDIFLWLLYHQGQKIVLNSDCVSSIGLFNSFCEIKVITILSIRFIQIFDSQFNI